MAEESFQNNFFDTEYLKADLKGRSVRGGAVTMAAQGVRFFLQMGSTMVLARLLTPQDFGLIAMVTVVTGFVMMFKDMGLSIATVQRAEINHGQISTLFWINVVLSLGVMLVTAALAPAIAWFYGEPRLTWITLALASAFIFGGFTIQHQALLRRQMRFGKLAAVEIISMLVGIAAAIIAAWYGVGYWALVIMQLATAISGAIAVWVACGWRPGLPVRRSGVREMLAFGGNLTGFRIVNYFGRNLDNVLIGRFCGPGVLGFYNKAYNLLLLPIRQITGPITSVAVPALSRIQNQPERFLSFYKKGIFLIAFVTMPLILFLFATVELVILIVLGNQWADAAIIFRLLAPAAFIGTFNVATGWVYISLGQTNRQLRMGSICSLVTILGFAIGVRWDAIGVAIALSIVSCVMLYPRISYCYKRSPMEMRDLLDILWKPALTSIIACASVFLANEVLSLDYGVVVEFVVKLSTFVVFYFLSWSFMPKGRETLCEVLQIIRNLRSTSKEVSKGR